MSERKEIVIGTPENPVLILFPRLRDPKKFNADSKTYRFELTAILDPSIPAHKKSIEEIQAEIARVAKEKYGNDVSVAGLVEENRVFLVNNVRTDGSQRKTGKPGTAYSAFEGKYYVSISKNLRKAEMAQYEALKLEGNSDKLNAFLNDVRPGVQGRDGKAVLPGSAQFPYNGSFGRVKLSAWAQPNGQWGKRVNGNLLKVQFLRDGVNYGEGGGNDAEDFDGVEDAKTDAPADAKSGW